MKKCKDLFFYISKLVSMSCSYFLWPYYDCKVSKSNKSVVPLLNLCLSLMLASLSCSFTSISFLTNKIIQWNLSFVEMSITWHKETIIFQWQSKLVTQIVPPLPQTCYPDYPIPPSFVYMYIEYYWRNVWRNQSGIQNP